MSQSYSPPELGWAATKPKAWRRDTQDRLAAQVGASGIVGVTVEVKIHVWVSATEFLATGTAVRRLAAEHKLPETTPKPTFTLGLDS